MQFSYSVILILQYISWIAIRQVWAIPLNQTEVALDDYDDPSLVEDYANMKYDLIHKFGYSEEFADMIEINLKRAVRAEKERQRQEGISSSPKPNLQRQQISEEYDDDESTLPPGPTTPGPTPGDIVRGVAGIITSIGTLNPPNFWGSFVNFFPPNRREGAQAVVESTLGRRPAKWPTLPTTTTKLTTTTLDPDDIDSDESTTLSVIVTVVPASATATTVSPGTITAAPGAGAAVTQAAVANVAPATSVGTRAPTTKYTVRRRTGTVFPDVGAAVTEVAGITNNEPLKVSSNALVEDDETDLLSTSSTTIPLSS